MFLQLVKDWKGQPAGARIDVPDEYAPLLIDNGTAKACADPTTELVNRAVEQAAGRLTESMNGVINLALQKFADAQTQAKRSAVPAIFGDGTRGNPKHCFGDWLLHVAGDDGAYLEKEYGSVKTKAALAESSGSAGGYVVPPEFYHQLQELIAEEAILRPRAFVQPMASAKLMFPFLDVTTAQAAGTSAYFGGVLMQWTEEAQTRSETEPAFRQMELKAHELSGYAVSSNVVGLLAPRLDALDQLHQPPGYRGAVFEVFLIVVQPHQPVGGAEDCPRLVQQVDQPPLFRVERSHAAIRRDSRSARVS